jgi:hypothetical protein
MAVKTTGSKKIDTPIVLGKIGMWLAAVAFGGVFWAINGGFSVIGLGVMAGSFNDAGRLFWLAVSSITFSVPGLRPEQLVVLGLSPNQPLVPWMGVAAATCVQISVLWLKMSGRAAPVPLLLAAILLSIYDYVTTFFGLTTVSWIAVIGWPVAALLAVPITFALEAMISYALRR